MVELATVRGAESAAGWAAVRVCRTTTDGRDPQTVIDRAIVDSTASNSVATGFTVADQIGPAHPALG